MYTCVLFICLLFCPNTCLSFSIDLSFCFRLLSFVQSSFCSSLSVYCPSVRLSYPDPTVFLSICPTFQQSVRRLFVLISDNLLSFLSNCLSALPRSDHADVGLVSLPVSDGRLRLLDDVHDPAAQLRVEVQVVDVRPEQKQGNF